MANHRADRSLEKFFNPTLKFFKDKNGVYVSDKSKEFDSSGFVCVGDMERSFKNCWIQNFGGWYHLIRLYSVMNLIPRDAKRKLLIVDLGCSTGESLGVLVGNRHKYCSVKGYIGIDPSRDIFKAVRRDFGSVKASFLKYDIRNRHLPLKKNCADILLFMETMEHLPLDLKVGRFLSNLLKDNGKIVFSAPLRCNNYSPFEVRSHKREGHIGLRSLDETVKDLGRYFDVLCWTAYRTRPFKVMHLYPKVFPEDSDYKKLSKVVDRGFLNTLYGYLLPIEESSGVYGVLVKKGRGKSFKELNDGKESYFGEVK